MALVLTRNAAYRLMTELQMRGAMPDGPVKLLQCPGDMQTPDGLMFAQMATVIQAGGPGWICAWTPTTNRVPT